MTYDEWVETHKPIKNEIVETFLDEDESRCRTENCTEDANNGEGFDGYCGTCADRREANNEGIES